MEHFNIFLVCIYILLGNKIVERGHRSIKDCFEEKVFYACGGVEFKIDIYKVLLKH